MSFWFLFFIIECAAAIFLFLRIAEKRRAARAAASEAPSSPPVAGTAGSPDHPPTPPWPLKEILIGIFAPFLFTGISGLLNLYLVELKPWRAGYVFLATVVLFECFLFIYPAIICKRRGVWPLFHPISPEKALSVLFFSFLVAMGTNFLVGTSHLLLERIAGKNLEVPDYSALATSAPNSLLSILILLMGFTVGPLVEEIYFRGFLYNAFKRRIGLLEATILQAVLFAAVHGAGFMVSILYFLSGVILAIVYEKKGALIYPTAVHVLINAMALVPLLTLALQNFHMPASSWEEAKQPPAWLGSSPPAWIEKKEDAETQRQYAVNTWGNKGARHWKKEAIALQAVCSWFPEDRAACAKAKVGILSIYLDYMKDYRRAVIEGDRVLSQFPEQKEDVDMALSKQGMAYLMLKDFTMSRQAFEQVVREPGENQEAYEEAEKGIKWLNTIEGRGR